MDHVFGVGADALMGGEADGDDDAAGHGDGGIPGLGGGEVVAAPRYSVQQVENLARIDDWNGLEQYVMSFVPEAVRQLHPELLLLCRRGQFVNLRAEGATAYFDHKVKPLLSQSTPFVEVGAFTVKVDQISGRLLTGAPINQLPNVADQVNDYMRFYFGESIGYHVPGQENGTLWAFAFQTGFHANGQRKFRCVLCQKKYKKVSLEKQYDMIHIHLTECPGMNPYTSNMVKDIVKEDLEPVERPSNFPVTVPQKQATNGVQILEKLSLSRANPIFLEMLQECVNAIINADDSVTINSQVLNGKAILLDMVLDTNAPRELCVELRNWLSSMQGVHTTDPCEQINNDTFLEDILAAGNNPEDL